jgi:hypothetical protein
VKIRKEANNRVASRGWSKGFEVVLAGVLMLAGGIALRADDRQYQDIFAGVNGGNFQVWHNSGTDAAPNYALAVPDSTISDGNANNTAACILDPTYHLGTANAGNTVFRHFLENPNNVLPFPKPAGVFAAPRFATASPPTTLAYDTHGNLFVGEPDRIEEFDPTGALVSTFTPTNGPLAWIDLDTNGNLYFTNGTDNHVYSFSIAGGCSGCTPTTFASIGDADTGLQVTLHTIKVLPAPTQAATGGFMLVTIEGLEIEDERPNKEAGPPEDTPGEDLFSRIWLISSAGGTVATPLQAWGVSGENNFEVLTPDPDGTRFWAGNPVTNNFFRFNLSNSNAPDVTLNTGVGSGPTGLCAFGAFGAAQPQPLTVTTTLDKNTPGLDAFVEPVPSAANPTLVLGRPVANCPPPPATQVCNEFTWTAYHTLNAPTPATLQYVQIEPSAACDTDTSPALHCVLGSLDGAHAEVWSMSGGLGNNVNVEQAVSVFSIQPSFNPELWDNKFFDETDSIFHGSTRTSGSCTNPPTTTCRTNSVFTQQDRPLNDVLITGNSCGYSTPLPGQEFNQGRNVPVKFNAVQGDGSTCPKGVALTGLIPGAIVVQLNNFQFPNPGNVPIQVLPQPGQPPLAYSPDGAGSWILGLDTSSLQGRVNGRDTQFLLTTFDMNAPPLMPAFNCSIVPNPVGGACNPGGDPITFQLR